MRILIITGGHSSERAISLLSATNVQRAAESNGHSVELFDFQEGYDALSERLDRFDLIFPVMHGFEGEDGTLYQYLRSSGKRYIGSNPEGASIAFDKIAFKFYCEKHDIPTPAWTKIQGKEDIVNFGFPCVLKAAKGGSSHEVIPLFHPQDLDNQQTKHLLQQDNLFVEQHLTGIEVTAGVLHDQALPVIEIIPPGNGWFDYTHKYSGESREIPFAPSLPEEMQRAIQTIALDIHHSLKLNSFSRTDIIVANNIPYVLEVNTPGGVGLTQNSLLPKAAQAAGISFEALIEAIIL